MQKNYMVGKFELDDFQMQLLKNDENTIVIAGAGSGKTLTIVGKINYLIDSNITSPENILVISFTNASVNDLKEKINFPIKIYTFHKLAMYILDEVNYKYFICSSNYLYFIIEENVKCSSINEQKMILKFLKLNMSFSQFLLTKEYQSFCKLVETFINLWKTNNLKFSDIPLNNYSKLEKNIILFIFNIYKKYCIEKNSISSLDFDDLILMATKYVKDANLSFKYIIIDEFQDTSFIRISLIKEIFKYTNGKIIVVGDDWQSIYRFSGCNLRIFINFSSIFPNVRIIKLINTYRNSQELINIASSFIMKNPYQIKKKLISNKNIPNPIILVPFTDKIFTFKKVLNFILETSEDIMILSRNNNDIYSYLDKEIKYENNFVYYLNKKFKYYTVHKSKGLESEYVIILNCNNNILGFPNKIENSKIINKLYQDNEIKFAEERRLFYVAITRCKIQTFILYDKYYPSIFIKEIKKIIRKNVGKISYF